MAARDSGTRGSAVEQSDISKQLRSFAISVRSHRNAVLAAEEALDPLTYYRHLELATDSLAIEFGKFKPVVIAIVGSRTATQQGVERDPWFDALSTEYLGPTVLPALAYVVQFVSEAIGYLEGSDLRAAIPSLVQGEGRPRRTVLISHDGESPMRTALEMECWRIGLNPVVVEARPSRNESVDEKVDRFLDDAGFAVVLARREVGATQNGDVVPRGSVIDEIARIRAKLSDKYIVLLEEGMHLPTTLATGITYRSYSIDRFDRAILDVFDAMREYGVI